MPGLTGIVFRVSHFNLEIYKALSTYSIVLYRVPYSPVPMETFN